MSAAIPAQAFMAQTYAGKQQPIKSGCEKRQRKPRLSRAAAKSASATFRH
jgi:hypothetical protein